MRGLEQQGRRALRFYPRTWRDQWSDVVLGTMLDAADSGAADRRAELRSLALHGLAARAAFFTNPAARRGAAVLALATGASFSVVQAATAAATSVGSRGVPHSGVELLSSAPVGSAILAALWLAAVSGGVVNIERLRRSALSAVVVATAALEVLEIVHPFAGAVTGYALVLQAASAAIALVSRPQAPGALTGATLLSGAIFVLIAHGSGAFLSPAWSRIWATGPINAAGLTIALLVTALFAGVFINLTRPQSAAALLLAAGPWIAVWTAELVTNPDRYFEFPFQIYSASALVISAVLLAALHFRTQRRLSLRGPRPARTSSAS